MSYVEQLCGGVCHMCSNSVQGWYVIRGATLHKGDMSCEATLHRDAMPLCIGVICPTWSNFAQGWYIISRASLHSGDMSYAEQLCTGVVCHMWSNSAKGWYVICIQKNEGTLHRGSVWYVEQLCAQIVCHMWMKSELKFKIKDEGTKRPDLERRAYFIIPQGQSYWLVLEDAWAGRSCSVTWCEDASFTSDWLTPWASLSVCTLVVSLDQTMDLMRHDMPLCRNMHTIRSLLDDDDDVDDDLPFQHHKPDLQRDNEECKLTCLMAYDSRV